MNRPRFTITTYGCAEYLQRTGRVQLGELLILRVVQPTVSISEIKRKVAEWYGLPRAEMTSARRAREVARPRQIAMYLSKQLTPRSLPEIGRQFGHRDHTTVIHAVRQIEKLRSEDAELDNDVRVLWRELETENEEKSLCPQH